MDPNESIGATGLRWHLSSGCLQPSTIAPIADCNFCASFAIVRGICVVTLALPSSDDRSSSGKNNNGGGDSINSSSSGKSNSARAERESYVEWNRSQAARADELMRRAAGRAKQLLGLMIALGYCGPERHGGHGAEGDDAGVAGMTGSQAAGAGLPAVPLPLSRYEPGMRPN